MTALPAALAYLAEHRARHVEVLCAFPSIPSVSLDPAHQADIAQAAE